MNWIQLKAPPKNFENYIGTPDGNTPEISERNLRDLMQQKFPNIMAVNFDVSIIKNLESELIKNKYTVQFFPSEVASYATFFLEKV
jgi:hypothetical protein